MATKSKSKAVTRSKPKTPAQAKKTVKRKKKGFLGDLLNPTTATNSLKSMVAASGGGTAAVGFQRILPTKWQTGARLAASVGVAFIGHAVLQSPNLASGFLGGNIALIVAKEQYGMTGLYENGAGYVDPDALRDAPLFMDEDGNALYMDENGDYHQLTEEQLSELAEDVEYIEV